MTPREYFAGQALHAMLILGVGRNAAQPPLDPNGAGGADALKMELSTIAMGAQMTADALCAQLERVPDPELGRGATSQ